MKTNRRRKDLFGKMKKGTLIALLCVGGITASAQTIGGNVYGGGNAAEVDSNTVVKIQDGTVKSVFGGGCKANVKGYADVLVVGGTVETAVFGGNDINGTVLGGVGADPTITTPSTRNDTTGVTTAAFVRIKDAPTVAKVFGGGNGNYPYDDPEYAGMSAPTLTTTYVKVDMTASGHIDSAVFGGGNAATVNTTEVHINNYGNIHYVFGGGNAATVLTSTTVYIDADGTINIDTVFGGNNKAAMNILPYIDLKSGKIHTVYGGGNAGAMTAQATAPNKDVFNENASDLSTYLYLYSDAIKINDVYGGCRDAQVAHNTFIDIRTTKTGSDAIVNVFGGNDHGGDVLNTRIDAVGGTITNIYGASNGNYFKDNSGDRILSYQFPNCASTNVNIYGGNFTNVYGGGYAGNVTGDTYLLLNDQLGGSATATIGGNLFGGGYGYEPYALSNARNTENVGNVLGTAVTEAKHVTTLPTVMLYGGGNAGDVYNTLLTLYPTWDISLKAIYGGCRASNVTGTAHTILQPTTDATTKTSTLVFGGNDYAGTTANSLLEIYGGHYGKVYGAGNGAYAYTTTENPNLNGIADADKNIIPVSQVVVNNIYDCIIDENLYGGSELGYVYKNITPSSTGASDNLDDYASIVTNIHGGTIKSDVFGGAHGEKDGNQLVYGVKIINMDGGMVNYSLHGGSESVNDGYPAECNNTESTQRPSSIVNITGGTIRNRTFGGGYMGLIYGSVYVNIGKYAVDSSEVWTKEFNRTTYANFKPDTVDNNPVGAQLMVNDLALEKSIYNGADWGTSTDDGTGASLYYNTPCFFGGKSELSIDGRGYNTSNNVNDIPMLSLNESLYGSGTSSEGGDIDRIIKLKNYGEMTDCQNTERALKSIQRANTVYIQNVNLELLGTPSNVALFSTPNYSVSRIDQKMNFVDHNYIKIDAPIIEVAEMGFYTHTDNGETGISSDVTGQTIYETTTSNLGTYADATAECESCTWIQSHDNNIPYTILNVMGGHYIELRQWADTDHDNLIDAAAPYGAVKGYGFLLTEENFMIDVTARPKGTIPGGSTVNTTDGGFLSMYNDNNTAASNTELAYSLPTNDYRVWTVKCGLGNRRREVNIIAHKDPSKLASMDSTITVPSGFCTGDGCTGFAIATATLTLPPTAPGNYYTINGIIIDNETRTMSLTPATLYYDWNTNAITATNDGTEHENLEAYALGQIKSNAQNKFGLTIQPANNFTEHSPIIISGNSLSSNYGELKYIASSAERNTVPTAKLTLLYNTNFESNTQRVVVLNMTENIVGSDGHTVESTQPVEVVVTIETLTDKLSTNDLTLLAMFNDGINNVYEKKVLIPATQKNYDFYLKSISWEPVIIKKKTDPTVDSINYSDFFHVRDTNCNETDYSNTNFSLQFKLSEDISSSVSDNNAWRALYDRPTVKNGIGDFWNITHTEASGEGLNTTTWTYGTAAENDYGLLLADLDSRFTAAIDIALRYDGTEVFPKNDIIGTAQVKFIAFDRINSTSSDPKTEEFVININIRTRTKGDTIYVASANSVVRNGISLFPWNWNPETHSIDGLIKSTTGVPVIANHEVRDAGKMPDRYVQTLTDALDNNITGFIEGDVICIIDTLKITNDFVSRGSDYSIVQIIRYDGSNFLFPGDSCAYRGPMIHISNGGLFSAYNMRFDGKGIGKKCISSTATVDEDTKYDYASVSGAGTLDNRITALADNSGKKYFEMGSKNYLHETPQISDTTVAFGPIFLVTGDGSTLSLNNRTYVLNNFNMASEDDIPTSGTGEENVRNIAGDTYFGGGIQVRGSQKPIITSVSPDYPVFDKAPMVELTNSVEISGNLARAPKSDPSTWISGAKVSGAGIHVKNGIVILSTHPDATMKVQDNYYAYAQTSGNNTSITSAATGTSSDIPTTKGTSNPFYKADSKFELSDSYFTENDNNLKSNVYLTRTVSSATSADPIFDDNISDIVYLRSELSEKTKVGINKWFPDGTTTHRDTIQFAMAIASQTRAEEAFSNNNFPSDSNFEQIHHVSIDPYLIYYKRCTGFQLQDSLNVEGDLQAVRFDFEPESDAVPTYDKLSLRVKGGLFPRTYTWYQVDGEVLTELYKNTSKYSNYQIKNEDPDGAKRIESNSGSYRIDNMTDINPLTPIKTYKYRAVATDLMGCEKTKDIQVVIAKADVASKSITEPFVATAPVPGYWIDETKTNTGTESEPIWTAGNNSVYNTSSATDHQVNILRTITGVTITVTLIPEDGGEVTASLNGSTIISSVEDINKGVFSAGDVLTINAIPESGMQFMYWDYDPYAPASTEYIVPSKATTLGAYFAPNDYWYQNVTSKPAGYTTDYNGNVHISSVDGLAWLISVVNGLNGQQSRPMYFDTIFIDPAVTYDMGDHLWTPVGTDYQKFMGTVMADNGSSDPINISKIIVNEPNVNNAGMFGVLDGAELDNIKLTDATVRGLQYVGTLAAKAENRTKIQNCDVAGVAITTYASGGIAGSTQDSKIDKSNSNVTYRGSAIYNGGVAGISNLSDTITNNTAVSTSWLKNAIHQGGFSGTIGGDLRGPNDNSGNNDPTTSNTAYVANNFAVMNFGDEANVSILGGIAGKAENVVMENNYVYGDSQHGTTTGAIIGDMGDNVTVNNCFYETGMATSAIGNIAGENQSTRNITSFNGEGNRVTVSENVGGINNLTRILNNWVRQQPEPNYNTWRSDLENVNNGYPIFGTPDIIPVYDTIEYTTCDYYDWNGEAFYESGQYSRNFIVEDQFIDSTVTLMLTINSSMLSEFADSVQLGIDYYGHGFSFTATEQELIRRTVAKVMPTFEQRQRAASIAAVNALDDRLVRLRTRTVTRVVVARRRNIHFRRRKRGNGSDR